MDWFKTARNFKKMACDKLSPTEFVELEHFDTPTKHFLPGDATVRASEIPGIYKVQERYKGESAFKYFMDGVQKTILWQYYNYKGSQIPIFLHFSGAVIMERLKPDRFVPLDSLYRNALLVPTFLYEEVDIDGLEDTGAEKEWDLNEIKSKARIKSRIIRQEIEQTIVRRFLESVDSILVKDGNIFGTIKSPMVIGLIKTHRTLYLQKDYPHIHRKVWSMPEFYRSMVFSIQLMEGFTLSHKVNSFYLRIQQPTYPEMGLVRIEYNDSYLQPDEISSWIIAERWIRADCPRWDRQIYPIQLCENYLRTQMPRAHHIKAITNF